ncbi:hypothetical protein [Aestuariivirga sp.]|uniref:hypothetical protein n=1 Tax=Aestuariivirga sp. TaxID=2650926 RepID=UPI0039E31488
MPANLPMSFSDRQYFVDGLATVRNLASECGRGEHPKGSPLQDRCFALITAVDGVMAELLGDHSFSNVRAANPQQ